MQWMSSTAPVDTPCNAKGKKDIRVQWRVQWGSWCHTSRSEMDWVIEGTVPGTARVGLWPHAPSSVEVSGTGTAEDGVHRGSGQALRGGDERDGGS